MIFFFSSRGGTSEIVSVIGIAVMVVEEGAAELRENCLVVMIYIAWQEITLVVDQSVLLSTINKCKCAITIIILYKKLCF